MTAHSAPYRPAPGTIPTEPGVYTFRDSHDRVIYVGKAKNLRARLSNYFQDYDRLHPRTRTMVQSASQVRWTVVASELEALNLEYTWIKRFNPRFNVMYRDDKSYPMLAVSVREEFPRAYVYRGPRRKGIRYFGPYPKAWAIRETLESLTKVFPVRTCTKTVFNRHQAMGRPCLLGYIDKCSAPCVGNISAEDHRAQVNQFMSFLSGNTDRVTRRVRRDMEQAAEELDFERAASLRDQLQAMDKAMEKQAVVFSDSTDADLIAFVTDELEASVQIFHVRGGRIHGQRGWVVEKQETSNEALLAQFIHQFYGDEAAFAEATEAAVAGADSPASDAPRAQSEGPLEQTPLRYEHIPREVLVQYQPEQADELTEWLSSLRGSQVTVRVPQRGDKKALLTTAETNAQQALAHHKLKRSGDLTARSAALQELQEALWMETSPLRIECIDISHIQGTDVVASLVVFEDGLPKKSDYRRYKIRDAAGDGHSDDVASIAEVVRRRFARHHADSTSVPLGDEAGDLLEGEEELGPASGDNTDEQAARKFAYPPQLFIVDGGQPQVNAAAAVLEELGVMDVFLVGIAKRLEELWVPGEEYPVIVARNSQALYLVQQIRDEAHRFAITFHRQQRSARMRRSVLDDIPGLGPQRRAQLVKAFGSVAKVKSASVDDICAVPGFGPALATAIVEALQDTGAPSAEKTAPSDTEIT
ncbi:excinuclease ABC subunit UvrC [Corynebacterium sp. 320]|uniref:excinuclease ABC subunit UvrC n=1 Tax=Corynebacterium TaxID=1716 RepID=UPI00125CCED1|nr:MULTISPECIES: excinuclease ABC subunit UvrC [Corynebacterium]KAB1503682.1 excinuclease ABC subunit UvrC [Corynebacterium sp. 320]KAB1553217.1 excinuclease ABC subunit UvrC [Corynebacterium sp. 321]KAB1553564.1 excinuclease ABC subunit UvrC [Corynebacterium sp. 319]KAB3527818.1 excinuclease ABC subunit UvrC [Corynebacterium sp. 250]KAB3540693.1 excinuclease ABC subunit UvrC [Corynebacterium sp. 366]